MFVQSRGLLVSIDLKLNLTYTHTYIKLKFLIFNKKSHCQYSISVSVKDSVLSMYEFRTFFISKS